jgi:hypothetical protein
MNVDETSAITLVAEMKRQELTLREAVDAMREYANQKQFQKDLDNVYNNRVLDDWDYWYDNDIV